MLTLLAVVTQLVSSVLKFAVIGNQQLLLCMSETVITKPLQAVMDESNLTLEFQICSERYLNHLARFHIPFFLEYQIFQVRLQAKSQIFYETECVNVFSMES